MDSVNIYNDSMLLVGGFNSVGIYRYDFNETHVWSISQVYQLPGDYIYGFTLNPLNKSEGFVSHAGEMRFQHVTFNGTHFINSQNNFQLSNASWSRDITFNSWGTRLLASHWDGTIYLLSLCPVENCSLCQTIIKCSNCFVNEFNEVYINCNASKIKRKKNFI